MRLVLLLLLIVVVFGYDPTWQSIDSRPVPDWYDWSKFGIFCHWGVFSVPAHTSEWFWWYWKGEKSKDAIDFMAKNYKPGYSYADFAADFTAELFDASQFVDIVKHSGAKYFVLTSKHHEGYTMWPSNTSWNWNAMDVGPHRDIVGELRDAFVKDGRVQFGLYFSQMDWFHRLYLRDAETGTTDDYVQQVSYRQMVELVNTYRPKLIWSDGDWERPDSYWKSKEFLAWLYTSSPIKDTVVVNDRWGKDMPGKHGGFLTFTDHFDPGHLIARKWENCMTLDKHSWGYRRAMRSDDVVSVLDIITQLARSISCGGNLLLNIGPTMHGTIPPIFEDRLRKVGAWLRTNSEAVYGSRPWIYQNDTNVWYTSRLRSGTKTDRVFNEQVKANTIVYAFVLEWPSHGHLILPSIKVNSKTRAQILGHNHHLPINNVNGSALVDMSAISWHSLPSFEAWVIRLEYLDSEDRDPIRQLQLAGILNSQGLPIIRSSGTVADSSQEDGGIINKFEQMFDTVGDF